MGDLAQYAMMKHDRNQECTSREANVLKYYTTCIKLKDVIWNGWKDWNVKRERVESVAEHVFGVQMLALAMHSEYMYAIDIQKVLLMIAIHKIGKAVIGDITMFQMSPEEKKRREHEAVHNILQSLLSGDEIEELFLEFDKHETPEALFAYQCDKLECDLQCKIYDQEHCIDLNNQDSNKTFKDGKYDKNFKEVSDYAMNHEI